MRHHRGVRASAAIAALIAALTTPGAVAADEPLAEPVPPDRTAVGRVPGADAGPAEHVGAGLAGATGPVTAFVELAGTPAAAAFDGEKARGAGDAGAARAALASRQRIGDQATRVLEVLRGRDSATREVARTVNAVPGVVVTADAAEVRELIALPEVTAVRRAVPKSVRNAGSVRLTGAAEVWRRTGRHGAGVRIGIVDTGVDYTHADFGGPGTPAAHAAVDRAGPWTPTAKVVGGHDFAGDAYDADDPAKATPRPDPNPMDCQGHGTHVAGTAAGYGQNADGSTFTGDHRELTDARLDTLRIGPGTAPEAQLYALKVFGCTGSTDLVAQALDWALDPDGDGDFADRLDVVNLSLGSDFGSQDDPDGRFVRKLVEHGVLVVAAAGNGGDLYDVGGSPANTPEALAVANTRDGFALLDGVAVPGGGERPGQYSRNYPGYDALDLTAPVVTLADPANADGCDPIRQDLAGRIAWLEWDESDATRRCGSGPRADHAKAAGAVGVLLPATKDVFAAAIGGNADIPVFQFTGTATERVRPALAAGDLRVRMAGALRGSVPTTTPSLADTITPSSARGARGPVAAKPDVAAPGDTILSAAAGTGDDGVGMGGTSMAAPHVAGIGALVREAHPDWTVEEVKAAVMNTASGEVRSGDDHATGVEQAPMRVGAGRVDAAAAVAADLLAMVRDNPGSVGVSFGPVAAAHPTWRTKTVRVVNKGDEPRTLTASYRAATAVPGTEVEVWPRVVQVPAGGTADVRVTLRVLPWELRKVADPTVAGEQAGVARQFLAEASGRVLLTSGATTLRVPVYAAPEPVADVAAGALAFRGGTTAPLRLYGRSLDQGAGGQAYRSLVSAFELQGVSGRLPDCAEDVGVDCAVNASARGGDLRYVGAASTAPVDRSDGALLAFGVVTWDDWVTLGAPNTPEIRIDTTGDGAHDYLVRVGKPLDGNGGVVADVWLARTVRVADGEVVDEQPVNGRHGDVDTNVMDSNVVVLPVALKALGIDPAASSFRLSYTAGTAGSYPAPGNQDGLVDRIAEPMSFDPLKPGYAVRSGATPALSYVAEPGTRLDVHRDPGSLAADRSGGLLLLHHHNGPGARAEVVEPRG